MKRLTADATTTIRDIEMVGVKLHSRLKKKDFNIRFNFPCIVWAVAPAIADPTVILSVKDMRDYYPTNLFSPVIKFNNCLSLDGLPEVSLSSKLLLFGGEGSGITGLLSVVAAASAQLKIARVAKTEEIRFTLTIGTFKTEKVVPLELVKGYLELVEPTVVTRRIP